ncbi:MAG: ribonuclease III domain-containing protein [Promethearchaeota archaeon]
MIQALTTPRLGNEIGKPSYEFFETLGDAVIKVIFILKLYKKGIDDPGKITSIKASLESDNALKEVANKINLHEYIFKSEKQVVKGTRILADVFEALCGALFIDADFNFNIVEEILINPFYENTEIIIKNSEINIKSELLELLQYKFKTGVKIDLEYEKSGLEHNPTWIAKNPKILNIENKEELIHLPNSLKSSKCSSKINAEKEIFNKILEYLEREKS